MRENRSVETFAETYGLTLDTAQKKAVKRTAGTLLLLAVPGSGKTTTLISRLGYMTQVLGIDPKSILAITYTVSGCETMRSAYERRFGDESGDSVSFRTINGICWGIVWHYYRMQQRSVGVCDETQQRKIIRQLFREIRKEDFPAEGDVIAVQTGISLVKNRMMTEKEVAEQKWEVESFPDFCRRYQEILTRNKLVDYDDQMIFALKILKKEPQILKKLQKRYRHICVDEAQDTSLLQHRILYLLSSDADSRFFVGDEDQSIYGYRGACPEVLVNLKGMYPDTVLQKLETNYRSYSEITEAAKAFIDKNKQRIRKDMTAHRGSGGSVTVQEVKTRGAQLSELVNIFRERKEETAVLYRNNDSAAVLVDLLDRKKIPFVLNKPKDTFFSSRVVRDFRTFFQFSMDVENSELFLKCYSRFMLYFRAEQAQEAISRAAFAHTRLLDEFVRVHVRKAGGKRNGKRKGYYNDSSQGEKNAERFRKVFQTLNELTPTEAYKRLMDLGYRDYLRENELNEGTAELLSMIAGNTKTIPECLARMEQLEEWLKNGKDVHGKTPVFLSTIHSAKGMEFEHVILFDMIDGILPNGGNQQRSGEYQEERRLFYVGMTRAKNHLTMFAVKRGGSGFVHEIQAGIRRRMKQQAESTDPVSEEGGYLFVRDTDTGSFYLIEERSDHAIVKAWRVNRETGEVIKGSCTEKVQALMKADRLRIAEIRESEQSGKD